MATPSWQISGQYYETCSCDFVCPCIPAQLAVKPTNGSCTFAMAFQIERGKTRLGCRSTVWRSSFSASRPRRWERATGRSASSWMSARMPSNATRSPRSRAASKAVRWPRWEPWSESFWAWNRRRFVSGVRVPDGLSPRGSSWTWPRIRRWESTQMQRSRCFWRTRVIRRRIATLSRMQREATYPLWA